jgi:hypothetical protein
LPDRASKITDESTMLEDRCDVAVTANSAQKERERKAVHVHGNGIAAPRRTRTRTSHQ